MYFNFRSTAYHSTYFLYVVKEILLCVIKLLGDIARVWNCIESFFSDYVRMIGLFKSRCVGRRKAEPISSDNCAPTEIESNAFEELPEQEDDEDKKISVIGKRVFAMLNNDKLALSIEDRVCFDPSIVLQLLDSELQDSSCPYCQIKLTYQNVSFDRIDNSKIHYADNVILTCSPCNYARSDFYSVKEFMALCRMLTHMRLKPGEESFHLDISTISIPSSLKMKVASLNVSYEHIFCGELKVLKDHICETLKTLYPSKQYEIAAYVKSSNLWQEKAREIFFREIVDAKYDKSHVQLADRIISDVMSGDSIYVSSIIDNAET